MDGKTKREIIIHRDHNKELDWLENLIGSQGRCQAYVSQNCAVEYQHAFAGRRLCIVHQIQPVPIPVAAVSQMLPYCSSWENINT